MEAGTPNVACWSWASPISMFIEGTALSFSFCQCASFLSCSNHAHPLCIINIQKGEGDCIRDGGLHWTFHLFPTRPSIHSCAPEFPLPSWNAVYKAFSRLKSQSYQLLPILSFMLSLNYPCGTRHLIFNMLGPPSRHNSLQFFPPRKSVLPFKKSFLSWLSVMA